MFKVRLSDFVPGFRVGVADDQPGFRVEETKSGLQNPSAIDPNVVPAGAPAPWTPCVGGVCSEGGRFAGGGVIPHPLRPGQYLCPDCALKEYGIDILDPEILKLLDR
jgi:hypothetical protein